jgi:hypothetical protein
MYCIEIEPRCEHLAIFRGNYSLNLFRFWDIIIITDFLNGLEISPQEDEVGFFINIVILLKMGLYYLEGAV